MRPNLVSALLVVVSAALLIAACTGDDDATPSPEPTPTATAMPSTATSTPDITPTPAPLEERVLEAARTTLDGWLGSLAGPVISSTAASETWPDGCLGLSHGDEACDQALVEGFRVTITMGSAEYRIRTDLEARALRWEPETQILVRFVNASTNAAQFSTDDGGTIEARLVPGSQFELSELHEGPAVGIATVPAPQGGAPILLWTDLLAPDPAASAARDAALAALVSWLDVPATDLVAFRVEAVEWPNGCLGIARPGLFCTQAIVPGFRVSIDLVGSDARYQVRTNRAATVVVWFGPLGGSQTFESAANGEIEITEDGSGRVSVRLVPGSDLSVALEDLSQGDRVAVTMAPDPDGENFVVVTLDRLEE